MKTPAMIMIVGLSVTTLLFLVLSFMYQKSPLSQTELSQVIVEEERLVRMSNELEPLSTPPQKSKKTMELIKMIENLKRRDSAKPRPPGLDKYYMYDDSAKNALINILHWAEKSGTKLPFFANLIDEQDPIPFLPPKICILITSASRDHAPVSYLIQSITALLSRMDLMANKDRVYVHVFNVDNHTGVRFDEMEIVRQIVPVSDIKASTQGYDTSKFTIHFQENLDNALIMKMSRMIGCRYPIFMEDDAIADENWLDLLDSAIKQLERTPDWFAVKLFVARQSYTKNLRRGVNDYDQGFNTVSVLMNPSYVERFALELEEMVLKALQEQNPGIHDTKDHFYNKFRAKYNLKINAFEPVVFQHVGLFSSVSERKVDQEFAKNWYLFSETFQSDGKPIDFDPKRWSSINN
jgi:hypothetical protein